MKSKIKKETNLNNVLIIRNSRGKRISDEVFNSLPEKEKIRILRNRKTAKQTRKNRLIKINNLKKENSILECEIKLKIEQIKLLKLLNDDKSDDDMNNLPPLNVSPEYLDMLPKINIL